MIREIIAAQLPVGEKLRIVKNRIEGKDPDSRRIAIVSGIHGDEFEGQYVIYEMVRRLQEHPECLHGSVDLYPALNPLGMDMAVRELPGLHMDMNRIFPGNENGTALEKVAAAIVGDIAGADLAWIFMPVIFLYVRSRRCGSVRNLQKGCFPMRSF